MNAQLRRITSAYLLVTGLFWFAVALPLPLVYLLMQRRGLDLFQIGLLGSVYALTIVALELPTGGLADAWGRKRVTVLAYVLMAASTATALFAFSFPLFVLSFVLLGTGRALHSGALQAWFVDGLLAADPDIDLQPPLAHAGTAEILGLSLGTLAGGFLPELFPALPPDGSAVLTPLSVPLLGSLVLKAAGLVLLLALVREGPRRAAREPGVQPGEETGDPAGLRRILANAIRLTYRNPVLLLILGATAAGALAIAGVEAFWQPRFAELLGNAERTRLFGLLMTGAFAMAAAGNLVSISLSRAMGRRYALVAAFGQAAGGAALVALGLLGGPVPAAGAFWLFYLSRGLLNSPSAALLNREIPSESRSSMLSVASLAAYAGMFVGSALLGLIAERASIGAAWIGAGAVMAASVVLFLLVEGRLAARPAEATPTP